MKWRIMTAQLTKRPYYPSKINGRTFIKDNNGRIICCIDGLNREMGVLERTKLVITALNSHDELLEACKAVVAGVNPLNTLSLLEQAIAKAEGK